MRKAFAYLKNENQKDPKIIKLALKCLDLVRKPGSRRDFTSFFISINVCNKRELIEPILKIVDHVQGRGTKPIRKRRIHASIRVFRIGF